MTDVIDAAASPQALILAAVLFGLAPGVALRLIVRAFPRDDVRRTELLGELYAVPRFERPFWVLEQLERAVFEGLVARYSRWKRARRGSLSSGDEDEVAPHPKTGATAATTTESPSTVAALVSASASTQGHGYRGPAVCRVVGITYRQLDYWTTSGLVEPSVRDPAGSGSQRLYSFEDIVTLKVIKRLLDVGVSLSRVRRAIDYVRDRGLSLRNLTLASDGETVYAATDSNDVVDLLARGGGVFAIAVDPLYVELESYVSELPPD